MKRAYSAEKNVSEHSPEIKNSTVINSIVDNHQYYPSRQFSLGNNNNCVTVGTFAENAFVHLGEYRENVPLLTRKGINLSPTAWQGLVALIDRTKISYSRFVESFVVRDSLMISTEYIDNSLYIALQQYYKQKDFTRTFIPSICLLDENEWDKLQSITEDISNAAISIMYKEILPKLILKEVEQQQQQQQQPPPQSVGKNNEAEQILTTTLAEILSIHLQDNINRVFKCNGCDLNLGNQLGHECVLMDLSTTLHIYGELALTNVNLKNVASEFVRQTIQISNCITESFVRKLDMLAVLDTAKCLYKEN